MTRTFSQNDRLGKFHAPMGDGSLMLLEFNGRDQVNGLFDFRVEALAERDDLEFDALLGRHGSVELYSGLIGESAWFDGIVTEVEWRGARDNGQLYVLRLQPWLQLMSHRENQRIFHELKVDAILKQVFDAYGSSGQELYEFDLRKDYPVLEYTVQYRESDLTFACRLMQRFGLSYYFTHENGRHTLNVTDAVDTCPELTGGSRKFIGSKGDRVSEEEHFSVWIPQKKVATGAIRMNDFQFKKPDTWLEQDQAGSNEYTMGTMETYVFPGDMYPAGLEAQGSVNTAEGKARAGLRLDQVAARTGLHRGQGNTILLKSGMRLGVEGEKLPRVTGKNFVCMQARHRYVSPSYGTGGENEDQAYRGSYHFQEVSTPFVSARVLSDPMIYGPQTAKVVGEGEIDVDEFGRILVHFPWDLESAYSMRCRVSQGWAGKGWGSMMIPRIGMEVVVEFIEGHPDQPLVTGCVYNATNMPHYKLPAEKTRTILRTDTHQGSGFNELSFEDQDGEQEIYMRAMKDMNALVGNNLTEAVDNDKVELVGNSKISEITNSSKEVIGGDLIINVGPGNCETYTKGFRPEYSSGGDGLGAVRPDDATTLAVAHSGGDLPASQGEGNLIATVERHRDTTIGVNDTLAVGNNRDATVGADYTIDVGNKYTLTAGTRIVLECGASRLVMDASGKITLEGVKIQQTASSTFKIKAPRTDIN